MANIPTAQNNPGDIKQNGQISTFASPEEGKAALYNDLTAKMTGTSTTGIGPSSSLVDFAKVYAPDSDGNNSLQYAANLANKLNVSPDTQIGTLKGRIDDFASAISSNEGYQTPSQTSSPTPNPKTSSNSGLLQGLTQTTPTTNTPTVSSPTPYGAVGDAMQHFSTGVASSILGTAKFIGDMLGLKPTAFGEKLLASASNLDQGTAKNLGKVAGYTAQAAPAVGLLGTVVGGGASSAAVADTFPTVEEYMSNPETYEKVIQNAPPAQKASFIKKLIKGGLLFEGGKDILDTVIGGVKGLISNFIAPTVVPKEETINPAP